MKNCELFSLPLLNCFTDLSTKYLLNLDMVYDLAKIISGDSDSLVVYK